MLHFSIDKFPSKMSDSTQIRLTVGLGLSHMPKFVLNHFERNKSAPT